MIVDASADDIIYTDRLSGVPGNFLLPSLRKAGIDVTTLPPKAPDMGSLLKDDTVLWRDVWTAGQGVATIRDVPSVQKMVDRLVQEYVAACNLPASPAVAAG